MQMLAPHFSKDAAVPADSRKRPVSGLRLEAREETAFAGAFCASPDLLIIRHVAGPISAEVHTNDRLFARSLQSGGVLIVPPDSPFRLRLPRPGRNIYVTLPAGAGDFNCGLPALTADDPVLSGLLDMAEELADAFSNPTNAALKQTLEETLRAHVKTAYCGAESGSWQHRRAQARDTRSSAIVTEAVDFMFGNIDRSITLSDVGEHVGCSPSHLGRLFKTHLGISPHRYLLDLRVERARLLLAGTAQPIAQLALECGFASQEHLTRHFRRMCRTTPAAYRREQAQKAA